MLVTDSVDVEDARDGVERIVVALLLTETLNKPLVQLLESCL